jgi:GntR family transcriptional repressor for pyruvate dehydrogenase complex
MGDAGGGILFTQVRREPTLPDKVTQLLLDRIVDGSLPRGTKLPSERDLAGQLGVSRTVVREAVRTLQAKGVLDARSGSGVRVAELDASLIGEPMRLYIRASGALSGAGSGHLDELNEVRHTLEVRLAVLACETATADDLDRLRAAHAAFVAADDVETASRCDVAFHRTIAEITHNRLYGVLLDAIGDVLLDIRRRTLRAPGNVPLAVEQHAAVLDAITSRDPDAARDAMHRHLEDARRVQVETERSPDR